MRKSTGQLAGIGAPWGWVRRGVGFGEELGLGSARVSLGVAHQKHYSQKECERNLYAIQGKLAMAGQHCMHFVCIFTWCPHTWGALCMHVYVASVSAITS